MPKMTMEFRGKVEEKLLGNGVKVSGSGSFDGAPEYSSIGSYGPIHAERLGVVAGELHLERYHKKDD